MKSTEDAKLGPYLTVYGRIHAVLFYQGIALAFPYDLLTDAG
jgi:hypothetical protein